MYVFVGMNLFTREDAATDFEVSCQKRVYSNFYTVKFKRVSCFSLDSLSQVQMESHPFALSFINNIIKQALRASKLKQIGRNPRFFDEN